MSDSTLFQGNVRAGGLSSTSSNFNYEMYEYFLFVKTLIVMLTAIVFPMNYHYPLQNITFSQVLTNNTLSFFKWTNTWNDNDRSPQMNTLCLLPALWSFDGFCKRWGRKYIFPTSLLDFVWWSVQLIMGFGSWQRGKQLSFDMINIVKENI